MALLGKATKYFPVLVKHWQLLDVNLQHIGLNRWSPIICSQTRQCSGHHKIEHANNPEVYDMVRKQTVENPEEFWARQAHHGIDWFKKWDKVIDHSRPPFTKW